MSDMDRLRELASRIKALKPWQLAAIDDGDNWPDLLVRVASEYEAVSLDYNHLIKVSDR